MGPDETVTDDRIDAAIALGREHMRREPVAVEATYDPLHDRVVIVLNSNILIGFPRPITRRITEEVTIGKQRVHETQHVSETLEEEVLNVEHDTVGPRNPAEF